MNAPDAALAAGFRASSRKEGRRFGRLLTVVVPLVLGCLLLAVQQPAHAASAGAIVNGKANRCLDVSGGNTDPKGALVIIFDCHDGSNQQWEYTAKKELRTLGGSRCLDVIGNNTAPQTFVQSYPCNGGDNQKWNLPADGSIVSVQSGLCLTLRSAATANGTRVDMWPCQGVVHQQWTVKGNAGTDTQAPTPPTALSVSTPSCRSATLNWMASTDNVGVAFYDVYHDGQLITSVAGNLLGTTVPATPGALWGFYVNARDASGNLSPSSNKVMTGIPQCAVDTQPPSTPTGLKGSVSGTSATLSWVASSDNIGVAGYDIYRNNAKVGSTANTSFTDSGLSPKTSYTYSLAAFDGQKNVSGRSTSISLTTGAGCATAICSVTQVTADTDIPWGLLQLPDGKLLYSRRDAQNIVLLDPVNGGKSSIGTVPNVTSTNGEGGLLGLAVTPDFPATDNWLYIYHTTASDNRIVRIRYINGKLDNSTEQVLLKGIKFSTFHNGGRLRFGPDGKLYASVGDAENGANAQDTNGLNGKVLRLNVDGSVPSDNPFDNYVWSYGHRNPQGLAFDSQGRLWEQEFGNSREDETNLIVRGGNYGWPNCEGTVSQGGQGCSTPGYIAPKRVYNTAEGSCSGIAIVRDVIYVACERGERLYREEISGSSLTNVQQFFNGTYKRIRTVEPSIDGGLWMTTSNGGDKDSVPDNTAAEIYKVELGK